MNAPETSTDAGNVRTSATEIKPAAANAIRKLAQYVEANSKKTNALAVIAPLVSQAADLYKGGQYAAALALVLVAYHRIATLKQTLLPNLPDPQIA